MATTSVDWPPDERSIEPLIDPISCWRVVGDGEPENGSFLALALPGSGPRGARILASPHAHTHPGDRFSQVVPRLMPRDYG